MPGGTVGPGRLTLIALRSHSARPAPGPGAALTAGTTGTAVSLSTSSSSGKVIADLIDVYASGVVDGESHIVRVSAVASASARTALPAATAGPPAAGRNAAISMSAVLTVTASTSAPAFLSLCSGTGSHVDDQWAVQRRNLHIYDGAILTIPAVGARKALYAHQTRVSVTRVVVSARPRVVLAVGGPRRDLRLWIGNVAAPEIGDGRRIVAVARDAHFAPLSLSAKRTIT
jgi:hypothetical protein